MKIASLVQMNALTAEDIKASGGLFAHNPLGLEDDEHKAILEILNRENKTDDRYLNVSKYSQDLRQRLLKRYQKAGCHSVRWHLSPEGKIYYNEITLGLPDSSTVTLIPPPSSWTILQNLLCYGLSVPLQVKVVPTYQDGFRSELKPFYQYWTLVGASRTPDIEHKADGKSNTIMRHVLKLIVSSTVTFGRVKDDKIQEETLLAGSMIELNYWSINNTFSLNGCSFAGIHNIRKALQECYVIEVDEESLMVSADSFILSHIPQYQERLRDLMGLPKELVGIISSYIIM